MRFFLCFLILSSTSAFSDVLEDFERIERMVFKKIIREEKERDENCRWSKSRTMARILFKKSERIAMASLCEAHQKEVRKLIEVEKTVKKSIQIIQFIYRVAETSDGVDIKKSLTPRVRSKKDRVSSQVITSLSPKEQDEDQISDSELTDSQIRDYLDGKFYKFTKGADEGFKLMESFLREGMKNWFQFFNQQDIYSVNYLLTLEKAFNHSFNGEWLETLDYVFLNEKEVL